MTRHTVIYGGARWAAATRALRALSSLILFAVAARYLTPAQVGFFTVTMVMVGAVQEVIESGLGNAILRYQDLSWGFQAAAHGWLLLLAAAVAVCLLLAAPEISQILSDGRIEGGIRIASIYMVVGAAGALPQWLLRRHLRFDLLGLSNMGGSLTFLGVAVLLLLRGFGYEALLYGATVGAATRGAVAVVSAARLGMVALPSFAVTQLLDRPDVLRYAGFQLIERVVYYAGNNADYMILVILGTADEVGVYALAYGLLISAVRLVAGSLMSGGFPVLAGLRSRQDQSKAVTAVLHTYFAVVIPTFVAGSCFARELFGLIYGDGWGRSATVFILLAPYAFYYGLRAIGTGATQALGFPRTSLAISSVSIVTVIGAGSVGAMVWQAEGLAIAASMVGIVVLVPVEAARLRRLELWRRSIPASAVKHCLVAGLSFLPPGSSWIALGRPFGIGGVIVVGMVGIGIYLVAAATLFPASLQALSRLVGMPAKAS